MNPARTGRTGRADSPSPRTRDRVRDAVRAAVPSSITVVGVARVVCIHSNTARFHLDNLVGTGEIAVGIAPPDGRGRPAQVYRYVGVDTEQTGVVADQTGSENFRLLAEILTAGLADEDEPAACAERIGRRWGRACADARPGSDRDVAMALMDAHGFDPRWSEDGGTDRIDLHRCPFAESAERHGEVVCALHSGMLSGALEAAGGHRRLLRLIPHTEPGVCTATLSASA